MKFITCSDLHLTWKTPIARTDNFLDTAIYKLSWLKENYPEYPLLIPGDIFDKARPENSILLIAKVKEVLKNTFCIPGNHDLSYHSLNYFDTSAYGILDAMINIDIRYKEFEDFILYGYPFGQEIEHVEKGNKPLVAMTHQLTFEKTTIMDNGVSALYLLQEYPEYDIIITGDNHTFFITEYAGRYVINPGSLLRMKADQINYQPKAIIYDEGKIEEVDIPIEEDAVQRFHRDDMNDIKLAKDQMELYLEMTKNTELELFEFKEKLIARKKDVKGEQKKMLEGVINAIA